MSNEQKIKIKKGTKAVNTVTNTYLPVMEDTTVSVGEKITVKGRSGPKQFVFVRVISDDMILVIP